mgnify:CR=1 FL=1
MHVFWAAVLEVRVLLWFCTEIQAFLFVLRTALVPADLQERWPCPSPPIERELVSRRRWLGCVSRVFPVSGVPSRPVEVNRGLQRSASELHPDRHPLVWVAYQGALGLLLTTLIAHLRLLCRLRFDEVLRQQLSTPHNQLHVLD